MSGEKGKVDLNNIPPADDEDENLDSLDRGDGVDGSGQDDNDDNDENDGEGEGGKDDGKDKGAARDAKGRFERKKDGDKKDGKADGEGEGEGDDADEDEDDSDDEGDDESGEGDGKDNLPIRLNKARQQRDRAYSELDATNARLAEANARLADLEKAIKQAPKEDPASAINKELDDLYEQVEELRADGKTKEAAAAQRKIDAANRKLANLDADAVSRKAAFEAAQVTQFNAMLDVVEATVPELNLEHEDFDRGTVKRFERLVGAYEKDGLTPPQALREATQVMFRVDPFAKKGAKAPEKDKGGKDGKDGKKPDPKKAIDTQRRQPPDAGERGVHRDESKIRVAELSDEEFDKLPESKKAQLRGDVI